MKIQIANMKGIKFLLILVVFLIVIMLPAGATFVFPVIMSVKEVVYTFLELGGPYGIVHFLTGEVIGYIFIPRG